MTADDRSRTFVCRSARLIPLPNGFEAREVARFPDRQPQRKP